MREEHIDIFLSDLSPAKQAEVFKALGDDFDYDNEPVIEIDNLVYEEGEYEEETRPENGGTDIFRNRRRRGWRQQRFDRYPFT